MKKILEGLTEPMGVSGDEGKIRDYIISLTPEGYWYSIDHIGNLTWYPIGTEERTILTAHMDEIGLMVTGHTDDNKVKFTTVGGFDPRTLPNSQVLLKSGEYGVIGLPAPHITKDRDKVVAIEDLTIDIAAESKEEAEEVAPIGSTMVIISNTFSVGDTFFSRNTDNRAGCAVLIDIARKLKGKHGVALSFLVREEVGLMGMKTLMQDFVGIDVEVINLDVTVNTDFGKGCLIEMKDGGYLADRKMVDRLKKCGNNKVYVGLGGTSDHAISQTVVPSVGISFPSEYIHSSVSKVDIRDLKDASKLVIKYIKRYRR